MYNFSENEQAHLRGPPQSKRAGTFLQNDASLVNIDPAVQDRFVDHLFRNYLKPTPENTRKQFVPNFNIKLSSRQTAARVETQLEDATLRKSQEREYGV